LFGADGVGVAGAVGVAGEEYRGGEESTSYE